MTPAEDAAARGQRILDGLPPEGLFDAAQTAGAPCRIGPEPFRLDPDLLASLERQGRLWLKFVRAGQALYLKSHRGDAPAWIAEYLDAGKPSRVLDYGRMNRFKSQLPVVLRPDLLLGESGVVACELDSVPGGIGLLGCLNRLYEKEGFRCVGAPDGMVRAFGRALAHAAGKPLPRTAIVVSEESKMYRPEMRWIATALSEAGVPVRAVEPGDLEYEPGGARVRGDTAFLDVVYRFFELFDLANVPGAEALLNSAKLKRLRVTPPPKAHLEEKLSFALLHHPSLTTWWEAEMGARELEELRSLVAPTWILDPRPVPPHATVPRLSFGGRALQDWDVLAGLSQRERAFVLKPSGFSESAWGSHGVRFGADLSQKEWAGAVREALAAFPARPWILQQHHKPRRVKVPYFDPVSREIRELDGRTRLCPFYFVAGEDEVTLGGILATVCPPDKKAIHGMPDAIMIPCATS